ncbi:MAG: hypothetical protein HY048_17490 [Acidobacteria bacterium]|nr:hypothetical protein [Acidobacteriota bacterium]
MGLITETAIVLLGSALLGGITEQWLIAASLPVLWTVWRFLRFDDGPPVLAFALTFHWSQTVIGVYYYVLTGREPLALQADRYVEMTLISMACVAVFVAGLAIGARLVARWLTPRPAREFALGWSSLLIFYFALLIFRGSLREFAWNMSAGLTQGILALTYMRFGLFYLILRRLVTAQRFLYAAVLIAIELTLGMTGFFAEFKEPMFIAVLVLVEQFDYRRSKHWAALAVISVVMGVAGVLWIGIRTTQRETSESRQSTSVTEKLSFTSSLAQDWFAGSMTEKLNAVDGFVDRMWDVYYPALALARVPALLPHTDGALMMGALTHVLTPRILVPDKADLESDSLQVRRYSGIWVAGPEQGTTISFGYPIQGYIDYGIPGLFVPVLVFAIFMGGVYRFFVRIIRHRELGNAVVTVIFWMSLYQANKSWPKLLGLALTMIVYLGGFTILLDRFLSSNADAMDELARASQDRTHDRIRTA